MLEILKIIAIFLFSLVITALSEVLWHKKLFHPKKNGINRYLANLWNYDVDTHKDHHEICKERMEDSILDIEEYWVQKISNVFIAGFVAFVIEGTILFFLTSNKLDVILSGLFLALLFSIWYKFEDHFHIAMHKKHYYEKYIAGTWQNKWFMYCKRLHIIHHRDASVNFGFIFFPIGDIILGTYKHVYKKRNSMQYF
jgi:hypothetical protein